MPHQNRKQLELLQKLPILHFFCFFLQLQCMSDAEKSVDDVRRIERLLKAETGLRVIASTDAEVRSKSSIKLYLL